MQKIQLIGVDPAEFKQEIVNDLRNQILNDLKEAVREKRESYLTPDQVCKELGISRGTVNNWADRGILKLYRLGGRTYLKFSEIEKAMTTAEH